MVNLDFSMLPKNNLSIFGVPIDHTKKGPNLSWINIPLFESTEEAEEIFQMQEKGIFDYTQYIYYCDFDISKKSDKDKWCSKLAKKICNDFFSYYIASYGESYTICRYYFKTNEDLNLFKLMMYESPS